MALAATGLAFLALVVLSCPATAAAGIGDWRADQIRQAEEEFASVKVLSRQPLYLADSFPDGAKGLLIGGYPPRTAWFLPPGTPSATQEHYNSYCFSEALVLAQTQDSQSVLTSDDRAILTRTRLKVLDVIKAPPALAAGDQIAVVRFGGEVLDHGERLRVRDDGWSDFSPGHVYLLKLQSVQGRGMDHYFSLIYRETAFADLRLVREWDEFAAGTPYGDVKTELLSLPNRYACPPPR
ncbi:hypothetical protein [Roseateles sp.]|uniref:hypothetical protein n=1 Tax=Roseateles sp. TaxID=1971397 RepID=UPI003267ED3A